MMGQPSGGGGPAGTTTVPETSRSPPSTPETDRYTTLSCVLPISASGAEGFCTASESTTEPRKRLASGEISTCGSAERAACCVSGSELEHPASDAVATPTARIIANSRTGFFLTITIVSLVDSKRSVTASARFGHGVGQVLHGWRRGDPVRGGEVQNRVSVSGHLNTHLDTRAVQRADGGHTRIEADFSVARCLPVTDVDGHCRRCGQDARCLDAVTARHTSRTQGRHRLLLRVG